MAKTAKSATEHILPLYMNGLSGRMIKLPAPHGKKREMLLIAGHHTSLERIGGLAEFLNRYGSVTSPDLPGFGGMDSFYKIGEKPTMDNYADYLASFMKFRYKNRRVTIIAVSFGFSVVTRMLQKNPQIAQRTDLLVSLSGYVHKDDFRWKKVNIILLGGLAKLLSLRLPAYLTKILIIREPVIRLLYKIAQSRHPKLKDSDQISRQEAIDFEINLWKINDLRTYGYVGSKGFNLVLPRTHVDIGVHHVSVDDDHYFDKVRVEQHMRQIFRTFELIATKLPSHAPTVLSSPKDVAPFVPPRVRTLLRRRV